MNQVLNQDEINALLQGLSDGAEEIKQEAPTEEDASAARYDIASQDKIIRGRMPAMELIYDRFVRSFRTSLYKFIGKTCFINVGSIEIIKFGAFIKKLPQPASLHIFRMSPLQGYAMLVLSTPFIFSVIDTLFGGSGKGKGKIEGREFTPIESRLISKVTMMALETMKESWLPIHPVDFVYVRSEMNPLAMSIVPAADVVIIVTIEVELENESSTISICIPYSTIEPIRQKLTTGLQSTRFEIDNTTKTRMVQNLLRSDVNLRVELAKGNVKAKTISSLGLGDIIQLETDPTDFANVFIEGVKKFRGKVGTFHGSKAIKIMEDVLPETTPIEIQQSSSSS
ncbi:MAG: flagellar motor switch protein FliM [Deltaproteobacteria bacterium]|jgi:flagellar motor switch protein FliM|nr:flagellar motor switch protein FliM [Deltaproteobacteria bacterium]